MTFPSQTATTRQGGIAVDPKLGRLYVGGAYGELEIFSLSTKQLVANLRTACSGISDIVVDGSAGLAFVADGNGTTTCVIRLSDNTDIENVQVGDYASGIAVDRPLRTIFVSTSGSGTITAISKSTLDVTGTYPVNPVYTSTAMALDLPTQTLYMSDGNRQLVSYVNASTGTVEGTVNTSEYTFGTMVDDPIQHEVFVPNEDGSISVVSTKSHALVTTLRTHESDGPVLGAAFDPDLDLVLVTNPSKDSLSFITTG